jgi:hypothetical protein
VHRDLLDRSSTKDADRIVPVPQRRLDRLDADTAEAMTKPDLPPALTQAG